MKKSFLLYFIILMSLSVISVYAKAIKNSENVDKDISISNGIFSITIPSKANKTYSVVKKDKGIFIYHIASKKAGFGGFAFGIKLYKNPADHAMMPGGRKLGELIDKKGQLYDIVLCQPTDVQFDYTKDEPDSYKFLYELGEKVEIKGVRGNRYFKNQGMKGEELYKGVLQKHKIAIEEKWDSIKLEQENMSYMYNVIASTNKNVLDKVGYSYYDVNGDGIEELFIGELGDGDWKGIVYDIYTMVNRKPVHVVSGGSRDRYFVCDDYFLCNEYSSGALESGWLVYNLVENSTELFPQVGFKYDAYQNKINPWFISYHLGANQWKNVSEQTFKERKATFDGYKRFEYTSLSKIK